MKIENKDWKRMMDLVLSGKDGDGIASVLKNKNKAIARFVCGLKLENSTPVYHKSWNDYHCSFSEFGKKALELGATVEEIQLIFDETEIPKTISEKMEKLSNKELSNRFIGDIVKKILDAGFDINFLKHNGNAITNEGRDIMGRNGCKWTIGYKTEIVLGDKTVRFEFDAITDECDGPTSFVVYHGGSDRMFQNMPEYETLGKNNFIKLLMKTLK